MEDLAAFRYDIDLSYSLSDVWLSSRNFFHSAAVQFEDLPTNFFYLLTIVVAYFAYRETRKTTELNSSLFEIQRQNFRVVQDESMARVRAWLSCEPAPDPIYFEKSKTWKGIAGYYLPINVVIFNHGSMPAVSV